MPPLPPAALDVIDSMTIEEAREVIRSLMIDVLDAQDARDRERDALRFPKPSFWQWLFDR